MGPIPTILEFENVVASGNNYLWCLQATKVLSLYKDLGI